jgi:superfamily II DNA/RNA helicase
MPDMLSSRIQKTTMKRFPEGPTVVQRYMIPLILKTDKDLIGRSHTGTGKSAAFLIPIIEAIYSAKKNNPQQQNRINGTDPYAVIFVPTRDLCVQLAQEAKRLAEGLLYNKNTII